MYESSVNCLLSIRKVEEGIGNHLSSCKETAPFGQQSPHTFSLFTNFPEPNPNIPGTRAHSSPRIQHPTANTSRISPPKKRPTKRRSETEITRRTLRKHGRLGKDASPFRLHVPTPEKGVRDTINYGPSCIIHGIRRGISEWADRETSAPVASRPPRNGRPPPRRGPTWINRERIPDTQ